MQADKSFWKKAKGVIGKVPFLPDVVALYYCMIDPGTPLWVKLQIGGAVTYFVSPIDLIPDLLPLVGYTDDAAVIATTLKIVSLHVTREHKEKAQRWLHGPALDALPAT